MTLPLYTGFDPLASGFQFIELTPWIESFNVNYHLGIDGISLLLILLNSFTTVLVVIAGWEVIQERVAQYMAAFLFLSGFMNGVFCALDALLFYVFFEATLIPMFIIIGVWGGPNRVYAAVKFFLYTLLGLAAHAGRADLPLQRLRRQLLAARLLPAAAAARRADTDFPRVLRWRSR